MLNYQRISLIIPCKNEERIIANTIKNIPSYVDEIIVVDNGSTDNTAEVAQKAGAIVVKEPRKLNGIGYGYAHMAGLAKATGDYIFAMDGDDTYPSYQIEEIFNHMENKGYDFVSCSRLPLKNKKAISKTRRLGIYILNLEVLCLYGKRVNDILTGMWGIKREAVSKLDLRMGDWNLSPEIKIAAIFNKDIKFTEYHIDHFEREKEPSKQAIWNTGFNHLTYIFKRRFLQDSRLGNYMYVNLFKQRTALAKGTSIFAI